jgi:hypothetical protein
LTFSFLFSSKKKKKKKEREKEIKSKGGLLEASSMVDIRGLKIMAKQDLKKKNIPTNKSGTAFFRSFCNTYSTSEMKACA